MPPLIKSANQIQATHLLLSQQDVTGVLVTTPQTLQEDLENIRCIIKLISGETHWYDTPSSTLGNHAASHEIGGSDAVNHNSLAGFVSNEHIDWTNTSVQLMTSGNIRGGQGVFTSLDINGNADISGTLSLHGQTTISAVLDVESRIQTETLYIGTGTPSMGAYITEISGGLIVRGDSQFVTGTTLTVDTLITGAVTVTSLTASGETILNNNVSCSFGGKNYIFVNRLAGQTLELYNLPIPTLTHQAASKQYVDTQVTFYRAGAETLLGGDYKNKVISFVAIPGVTTSYAVTLSVTSTAASPYFILAVVKSRTSTSFTVDFSTPIPGTVGIASDYKLEYVVVKLN